MSAHDLAVWMKAGEGGGIRKEHTLTPEDRARAGHGITAGLAVVT